MTYYNLIVRLAHIAASIAAAVVAVGASIGFHDMTGSLWLAILGGVGIASILGLGWWALITAGSRARRGAAKAAIVSIGILLVAVALGTSGWALATAIGGKSAMTVHNAAQIELHETALNDAYARVAGQTGVIDAMSTASTAYSGYADAEVAGDLGNGGGCGPRCRTYQRAAEAIDTEADNLQSQVDGARDAQLAALGALAAARTSDDPALLLAEVASTVALLNAVDLDAGNIGILQYTATSTGLEGVSNEGLTQAIIDADKVLPPAVAVPEYRDVTKSEATLMYWDRVIGAWIAAFAIDVAPLVMLLIVMAMAMEPLLREAKPRIQLRPAKSNDEIRVKEDDVNNVTAFQRPAAE
jgi:hypothetical protein